MNEQQRLLMLIWSDDPALLAESGLDSRGVKVYQHNLIANAGRALSLSFPTIFKLLDSDISENLVRQFLKICPPNQGDWTQWGEEFIDFITVDQIASEYPYLPDCASLDWFVHCARQGNDKTLSHASLQLLSNIEPEQLVVMLNTNVALIKTNYPINEIYQAHHCSEQSQRDAAMNQVKLALSSPLEQQVVMISRPEFQPQVTRLTNSEATFMLSLNAKKSLAASLDAVKDFRDFSFENWLINAIEQNLIDCFKQE